MSQTTKIKPQTLEDYLNLNYPMTFYPESDGGYTVMMKDLLGCISQGDTLEEAFQNIQEAKQAWIETAFECGDEILLEYVQYGQIAVQRLTALQSV